METLKYQNTCEVWGRGEEKSCQKKYVHKVNIKRWAAPHCHSSGTVPAKPKGLLLVLLWNRVVHVCN